MTITIIGATGFVGTHLIKKLLTETNHVIRAVAPDIDVLRISHDRLVKMSGDVFSFDDMDRALTGADVAYYLVHMMNGEHDNFYEREAQAATTFAQSAQAMDVGRVIYMSGLGSDAEKLSQHLASRHNTGDILRKYVNEVIEFRASMIVGPGSISFDIVKSLVHKLPAMTLPKWSKTKTQPIGLGDALAYLVTGIDLQLEHHEIVEIGGPEAMSYQEFLHRYAEFIGKRIWLIRIPILPEWLAGRWLDIFTPKGHARVGRHMVASFRNEMTVTNHHAEELFPHIQPRPIEESFTR